MKLPVGRTGLFEEFFLVRRSYGVLDPPTVKENDSNIEDDFDNDDDKEGKWFYGQCYSFQSKVLWTNR